MFIENGGVRTLLKLLEDNLSDLGISSSQYEEIRNDYYKKQVEM